MENLNKYKYIIEVKTLSKTFGTALKALDNISFGVSPGEIFGFLGPNGAGKSTTIKILTTLLAATAGKAYVAGLDVAQYPEQVRKILGYVSQDLAIDDNLTGRENLFLLAHFYHLPNAQIIDRCNHLLRLVGLTDRADDLVETYSGGMRKRLDIATGLLHKPKILFLDEPTLGLDVQTRQQIWRHINELRRTENLTVFLTTHYMEEADVLCDRVAIIDRGVIKAVDTPSNLKKNLGQSLISLSFSSGTESEISKAIEALRSAPDTKEIRKSQNQYIIITTMGNEAIPAVFEIVRNYEVKIGMVSQKHPTLDDVYLAITGHGLKDQISSREEALQTRVRLRRTR